MKFSVVAVCLGLGVLHAAGAIHVAGTLQVDLRATDATNGLAVWSNRGTLGVFTNVGTAAYTSSVAGLPAVRFGSNDAFVGPASVPDIEGASDRSIEAWVYNPAMANEETVLEIGHRNTTARNCAFNYGTNLQWGACAQVGSTTYDVGWVQSTNIPPAGNWHHIVYTYNGGTQCFVFVDGTLRVTRNMPGQLNTFAGESILLGAQRGNTAGSPPSNFYFSGFVNTIRVHGGQLTAAAVASNYVHGPDLPAGATNPLTPAALPDSALLHRGQKVRIPVLTNDTGAIAPASVTIVDPPDFGSAVPDLLGRVLYTHTNGQPAADSFVYQVADNTGLMAAQATVTVSFANSLRIVPTNLFVPLAPPPSALQVNVAFNNTAFTDPVCIASPPGDTQRVFVCQKGGLLRVVTNLTGAGGAQTFLDLPALLTSRGEAISTQSEQGLLGLAFHPNYASNRQFYVFYSVAGTGFTNERVSRFTTQAGNPNAADTNSEVILIDQFDQAGNHNGGDLHFGPDGYLYVSLGDEGNQNDSFNNSQTITKDFFSGILRIDVDKKPGSLAPNHHPAIAAPTNYAIPPDNPFVGVTNFNGTNFAANIVRTEFWAIGMRNPWRISFDPTTGELWCGDVGGSIREEVDIVARGGNYGWAYREGLIAGPKTASAAFTNRIDPIYDYPHQSQAGDANFKGDSITGGRVYRGTRFSALAGKYVFADYVTGHLWTLLRNGTNVTVERIGGQSGIVAFGVDPSNGDILLANINNDRIYRLEYAMPAGGYPSTLDETGLFADVTDLTAAPGVLPYAVNLPFWSDHGIKRRWFTQLAATNVATWTPEGTWPSDPGTAWVKHFDFDVDPTNRVRVETRLLVRTTNGAYGVSYRWNTNGSDATLVADEGSNFVMSVVRDGVTNQQTWRIPSRAECLSCHNATAGFALSFGTRQFNLTNTIAGFPGNQIDLLRNGGCFANGTPSPNLLPRHLRPDEYPFPVEARVRSYLEVNCAYCHQAGGTAPTAWDGRAALTLEQTGLLNGNAVNNGGDPANKLVVPGDTLHSIVLNRIAASNGFTRMPPLGSSVIDTANVALVTAWILDVLPSRKNYADWRLSTFGTTNSPSGGPEQDPDGDGASNLQEFLFGTQGMNSNSVPAMALASAGNGISVRYAAPANRSAQVELSTNLATWTLWDVLGNAGLPGTGGWTSIDGPATNAAQFHRLRVREN